MNTLTEIAAELAKRGHTSLASKVIHVSVGDPAANKIKNMLDYIRELAGSGHGFTVLVDPKCDDEKEFYIDGDGEDRINEITMD